MPKSKSSGSRGLWLGGLLLLFTFLTPRGGAQTSSISCNAVIAVPTTLRVEGASDLLGDIVLECTGGSSSEYTIGSPLPVDTISVSLSSFNVTSRLLNNTVTPNISEALLLIDEPGSPLPPVIPGTGPAAPQTLCPSAMLGAGPGGCVQYPVAVAGYSMPAMSSSPTALTNPANVYQGLWNPAVPNQIQFPGVPVLAPAFAGVTRVYRITNIRANPSGFVGSITGTQSISVSITISGNATVALADPVQTAGFVEPSLIANTRNLANTGPLTVPIFTNCGGETSVTPTALLQFSENFGTAFKTRVIANSDYNAQGEFFSGSTYAQNVPGLIYNSESGFILNTPINGGTAGLSDYGTRLKATFHAIPAGVRMFVSVANVASISTLATGIATAALVNSETASDTSQVASFPVVAPTTVVGGIAVAELPVDGTGTSEAIWEVTGENPAALESFNFAVYQLYPPTTAGGTATVSLAYAPTPPASIAVSTWDMASGTLTLPRFADLSTPLLLYSLTGCVAPSSLAIRKSHTGNLTPGQQANYTVTVSNAAAAAATSGTVTVTENIPAGLALDFMSGTGWSCSGSACTRNDILGPGGSYPPITVTVNVAPNPPSQITNQVTVSGGGSPSASASDTDNLSTACSLDLSPASAALPPTGTSTVETCPNGSGQPNCGVAPEIPQTFTVTPSAFCGAWTATSSNPGVLAIASGGSGSGSGTVAFTLPNNTHTGAQSYTITVVSGSTSATYTISAAGSGNSQTYREVYALYEQILGRDPDPAGFAYWTGSGSAGLGQMGDSFVTSPEAFNRDFAVLAAYQAATGGAPSYAQFAAAVTSIRNGTQTVPGLFTVLLPAGYSSNNLYQNLLNRQPSSTDGTCVSSGVVACFQTIIGFPANTTPVNAPNNEFQSTGIFHTVVTADHTNALYIRMLYFVVLGRDPDIAGLVFWLGVANTGGPGVLFQGNVTYPTRIQIMGPGTAGQGFIGSPEFQNLFAN